MRSAEETSFRKTAAVSTALALFLTSSPLGSRTQTPQQKTPQQLAPGPESPIDITHDPLACMTPALAPEVDAGVRPGEDYDSGWVYYRQAGTLDYYWEFMEGPPATLVGILPRPEPDIKAVDYYLLASDLRGASKKEGEWTPPVVPGTSCRSKGRLVGPAGAGLTIGLTREGQNPYPSGFNKKDIAKVVLVSGVVLTIAEAVRAFNAAAASSGGGTGAGAGTAGPAGGLSTGAVVAGGALVAGAAAVAIVQANKDDKNPTATPTPTLTPTRTPTIPPQLFVQAEVSWSGVGDIDIRLLRQGSEVGQKFQTGCESTSNRTERVILQMPPTGLYTVELVGRPCSGLQNPSTISAVVSVQTDTGLVGSCANRFFNVQVSGGPFEACTFSLP